MRPNQKVFIYCNLAGLGIGVVVAVTAVHRERNAEHGSTVRALALKQPTATLFGNALVAAYSEDFAKIRKIRTPFHRINAIRKAILTIAESDPLGALDCARREPMPDLLLSQIRDTIMDDLVRKHGAWHILREGFSGFSASDLALLKFKAALVFAETDAMAAASWLCENHTQLREVPFSIIRVAAKTNPVDTIAALERIADPKTRELAILQAVEVAPSDYPGLNEMLVKLLAGYHSSKTYSHNEQGGTLTKLVIRLAALNPLAALAYSREYIGQDRSHLLSEVLLQTSKGDHGTALELARAEGDEVVDTAFWKWMDSSAADALNFALKLPIGKERDRLLLKGLSSEFSQGRLSDWTHLAPPGLIEQIGNGK